MHKIEKGWYWQKGGFYLFQKKKKQNKEKLMAAKFMMYCYNKKNTQQ